VHQIDNHSISQHTSMYSLTSVQWTDISLRSIQQIVPHSANVRSPLIQTKCPHVSERHQLSKLIPLTPTTLYSGHGHVRGCKPQV